LHNQSTGGCTTELRNQYCNRVAVVENAEMKHDKRRMSHGELSSSSESHKKEQQENKEEDFESRVYKVSAEARAKLWVESMANQAETGMESSTEN
jgi:hypothetical protein